MGRCLLTGVAQVLLLVCGLAVATHGAFAQFTQQGSKIAGQNTETFFGFQAALSGDGNTAIVLSGLVDTTPKARVYNRIGTTWSFDTELTASGVKFFDAALSADGDTAVIGGGLGPGGIAIFVRSGLGAWSQQGSTLHQTPFTADAQLGSAVAISADGNIVVAGGPGDNSNTGAVWVFTRSGGVWSQQGSKLVGDAPAGAQLGTSVAISGDGTTIIAGGPMASSQNGGAWAFVFDSGSGTWIQQDTALSGSNGSGARQGQSVALSDDGNTALVGGYKADGQTGAAWSFVRSGGVWTEQAKLSGNDSVGPSQQGSSVALSADGSTAIVGGPNDDSGTGATWVYTRSGGVWSQQGNKLIASDAVGAAFQGVSVALSSDGKTALIGGSGDDTNIGAVWPFIQPPIVTSVSPTGGPIAGGDTVTIHGANFTGANVNGLLFITADDPPQGASAANVVIVNDSTITGTSPAWTHGTGPVIVRVTTTERGNADGTFTYGTPPTGITSASSTAFTVQSAGTFTVTTNGGDPTPALSASGPLPSGVTFTDNGDGTATLAGTPDFATAGPYPLTITASNQVPLDATQSFTLTVNGASSTTVLATPAPSPSVVGQSVGFSATVPGNAAGTVTFNYGDGGQDIVNVASGAASHNHTYAAPGNYTVNAVFSGDSSYAGSTSFNGSQTVNKGGTTTTLSATPNPSAINQQVTLTATVAATAPAAGTPAGAVTFKDGATSLGDAALSSGVATLQTSFASAGAHAIRAVYAGNANFNGSTSSAKTQTVAAQPTITAINPNQGPANGGTSISIVGTNLAGATNVKFGTKLANSFNVQNATHAMATSPAHAIGAVDVTITTPGGTSVAAPGNKFTYTKTPVLTTIAKFRGGNNDGAKPRGGLVADANGVLYGVTTEGGAGNFGTIFKLTPSGGVFVKTILHQFKGADGATPFAGLVIDSAKNLYGVTAAGGTNNKGVLFKLSSATYKVLYNFQGTDADGGTPKATPARDAAGLLYGATTTGGSHFRGTTFTFKEPSTFKVTHHFTGADGENAENPLLLDSRKNLYGVTRTGGASSRGTMFKLAPDGTYTILHSFAASEGYFPRGALFMKGRTLYGTAFTGGATNNGAVFKLTPPNTADQVLFNFNNIDGQTPYGGVIGDGAGALYGATYLGGAQNLGVVFNLLPPANSQATWSESVMHSFRGGTNEGANPAAMSPLLGSNNTLYGTTVNGGSSACTDGCGTVFKVSY